jgi:hypothetical protein
MKLPPTTPKQQALIRLIYRYRFLKRKQLQAFLGHKDKRRISAWLKELRENQFIDWIYDPESPNEKSTPAIYFLGINGIRFLRQAEEYPEDELRKRYKDADRQQDFVAKCLLLADCAIHLEGRNRNRDDLRYTYALVTDYADSDNDYALLSESEYIHPDLVFTKEAETDDSLIDQTYFLQLFDLTTPRYMVKKKLKAYVEYFDDDEWEQYKGDEELPIVLIACPTIAEFIYAKRYTRKQLEEHDLGENKDVRIRFATVEKLRRHGLTAMIWEEVEN